MNHNTEPEYNQVLAKARKYWDQAAAFFDQVPDHGLTSESVLQAWIVLLKTGLQGFAGEILDVGCGTGSLSLLLADLGWRVIGIDISPAMIALARLKGRTGSHSIEFQVVDAASPPFRSASFDALIARHILWALPAPTQVLQRWTSLLKPAGRMLLIEGFWSTGGGMHADEIVAALPVDLKLLDVRNLSDQTALWGKEVTDELYVIIADRKS